MNDKRLKARRAAKEVRRLANENDHETEERTRAADEAARAVEQLATDNEEGLQLERRQHMDEFTAALKENTAAIIEMQKQFAVLVEARKAEIEKVTNLDCIVRGPKGDDGMVTDIVLIKNAVNSTKGILKYIFAPLTVSLIVAALSFIWALLSHTIVLAAK
jgi:hypothetical protein